MTKRERTAAEIRVAFDLARFLVKNPAALKDIPDGATVEVVSGDRTPSRTPRTRSSVVFVANRVFQKLHKAA